jgi:rRNA maturation endonuclease Nob1
MSSKSGAETKSPFRSVSQLTANQTQGKMNTMSNASTTVSSPFASNKKKGPKPIRTPEEIRAEALASGTDREIRKIDRKIATMERQRIVAARKHSQATGEIARLTELREAFLASTGVQTNA